jgi:hypothetical protein
VQDELQRKEVYKFQTDVDFVCDDAPAALATLRGKIKDTFCII